MTVRWREGATGAPPRSLPGPPGMLTTSSCSHGPSSRGPPHMLSTPGRTHRCGAVVLRCLAFPPQPRSRLSTPLQTVSVALVSGGTERGQGRGLEKVALCSFG